jgi:hypothetical protein
MYGPRRRCSAAAAGWRRRSASHSLFFLVSVLHVSTAFPLLKRLSLPNVCNRLVRAIYEPVMLRHGTHLILYILNNLYLVAD